MAQLKEITDMFDDLGRAMKDIEKALKIDPNDPEAPEKIAEALGKNLERELAPRTPLAETKEQAQQEKETQIVSRTETVEKLISDKIEGAM